MDHRQPNQELLLTATFRLAEAAPHRLFECTGSRIPIR